MVNRPLGNGYTDITDTYTYTYDTAGNILSETKTSGGTTTSKTYTYGNTGWRDLLTGFNGTTISYDGAGNPTSYTNGKTDYRFEWVKGRSLQYAAIMGDEQLQAFYKYDADGIRNFKDVDGMAHNYITQNGKVVRETIGSGTSAKVLDFIYDESGKPFALIYTNGTATPATYYYVLNLQGDVVGLVNSSGGWVAQYTYNAWGEIITSSGSMANINPLRYRGYYYDTETGFYYLQSRYYDPVTHRFINADSYASTGQGILGANMFAYCNNNAVMHTDSAGNFPGIGIGIGVGVGIAIMLLLTGCSAAPRNDLVQAPDLDITTASNESYNCYGNAIGKQIVADPTGYYWGMSEAEVFKAVQKDLGGEKNCVPLDSINSPVKEGWYMVALMCGLTDYHFIRLDEHGWYNKSGKNPAVGGCYISQEMVDCQKWRGVGIKDGKLTVFAEPGDPYYESETGPFYFAIRIGWGE